MPPIGNDNLIPIEPIVTPTTKLLLKNKQTRSRGLYLPGIPASVCARAFTVSPVAVVLLQVIGIQVRISNSLIISLPSNLVSPFGINSRQRRRALNALSDSGLIALEPVPGKRPIVTVIDKEYARWLLK